MRLGVHIHLVHLRVEQGHVPAFRQQQMDCLGVIRFGVDIQRIDVIQRPEQLVRPGPGPGGELPVAPGGDLGHGVPFAVNDGVPMVHRPLGNLRFRRDGFVQCVRRALAVTDVQVHRHQNHQRSQKYGPAPPLHQPEHRHPGDGRQGVPHEKVNGPQRYIRHHTDEEHGQQAQQAQIQIHKRPFAPAPLPVPQDHSYHHDTQQNQAKRAYKSVPALCIQVFQPRDALQPPDGGLQILLPLQGGLSPHLAVNGHAAGVDEFHQPVAQQVRHEHRQRQQGPLFPLQLTKHHRFQRPGVLIHIQRPQGLRHLRQPGQPPGQLVDPHGQHHDRRLPQTLHPRAETQRRGNERHGYKRPVGTTLQPPDIRAEHHKQRNEVRRVITAHEIKDLPLDSVHDIRPGHHRQHQRTAQQALMPPGKGAQHPIKTHQNQQGHHRCRRSHGRVQRQPHAVKQRRHHRGGDDVILVSEHPVFREHRLLLPKQLGNIGILVHVPGAKPGEPVEIDDAKHRKIGNHHRQQRRAHGPTLPRGLLQRVHPRRLFRQAPPPAPLDECVIKFQSLHLPVSGVVYAKCARMASATVCTVSRSR